MTETLKLRRKPSGVINGQLKTFAPFADDAAVVKIMAVDGPTMAPAWYDHATGEITIAYGAFNDLADADMRLVPSAGTPAAKLTGLVIHEAAHSRWSPWLVAFRKSAREKKISPAVTDVVTLLEELRIERRAVDESGYAKDALRSSFTIITENLVVPESMYTAASIWALVVGRRHAQVVIDQDIEDAVDMIAGVIPESITEELDELMAEAVSLTPEDPLTPDAEDRLVEIATRWVELVGSPAGGEQPAIGDVIDSSDPGDSPSPGDGEAGDGEGKGDGTGGDLDEDGTGEGAAPGDGDSKEPGGTSLVAGHGYSPPGPDDEPVVHITEEDAEWLLEAMEKVTDEVKANAHGAVYGGGGQRTMDPSKSRVWSTRSKRFEATAPSDKVRRQVTDLARALERLSYTAPHVVKVPSSVPPGRLDTRQAVLSSAQRSQGMMSTATPWERKKRKHVQNPPLTIGLMTDVSGSMRWAQNLVAEAAYVFAQATRRVAGRCAAVTFGDKAEAVVAPGELPTHVMVRPANGGSEAFDAGAAALEKVLHLVDGRPGAKLLVVVSDNHLVASGEPARRDQWLAKMQKAGVAVVWVGASTGEKNLQKYGCQLVSAEAFRKGSIKVMADAMQRAFDAHKI